MVQHEDGKCNIIMTWKDLISQQNAVQYTDRGAVLLDGVHTHHHLKWTNVIQSPASVSASINTYAARSNMAAHNFFVTGIREDYFLMLHGFINGKNLRFVHF